MKRILLHTCCAPCSVSCIPYLKEEDVEITAFWYNPNIHPFKEYEARRNCLAEYMEREKIPLILREDYGLREFVKNVAGDIEGRCTYCYSVRLAETAKTAKEMGFDGFTSTLFVSLYQNHELMVKKAEELAEKYGVEFYYRDFRPNFREGNLRAREMGLYMQKYCGCIFSEEDRYQSRINRLKQQGNLKYKNYIFDFGQVIVGFEPEYLTSRYIEDDEDKKLAVSVIFDRLYWDRLDNGGISDEEVRKCICDRLPQRLHENAVKVYDNWYRNLEFIKGMPCLLREIKAKGGKLYLLSNISNAFAENYASVPQLKEIFSLFEGLVFSAPLKLAKPNREIFLHLLNKYGLNPKESIFIDDNENNIKGAKSAGLNTYLFGGSAEELKKYL